MNVTEGQYGRQAVAAVENLEVIPKGTVLLQEDALCLSVIPDEDKNIKKSTSRETIVGESKEEIMNLNSSHLLLAWQLVKSNKTSDKDDVVTDEITKFDIFMRHFRPPSLLQMDLPVDSFDDSRRNAWMSALQSIVVMSVVSTITALLVNHCPNTSTDEHCGLQIFEVLYRLPHNSHAVSSFDTSVAGGVTMVSQLARFVGIFPVASALNHSCRANAVVRFLHTHDDDATFCRIEVVASREITNSEEICISYGPTAAMSLSTRRSILWNQYLFFCACKLCQQEEKMKMENISTCKATKHQYDMAKVEGDCIHWVKEMWEKIDTVRNEISVNMVCPDQVETYHNILKNYQIDVDYQLKILENSETKYRIKMSKPCRRHMTEISYTLCDLMGQVCAQSSNYEEALAHTQRGVDLYKYAHCKLNGLPEDDIMVSREEMKLIQLLFACEKKEECKLLAQKVIQNLEPFVNVNTDPDYVELLNIMEYL